MSSGQLSQHSIESETNPAVFREELTPDAKGPYFFFFFFVTLVTGPRRFLSLKLSDTRVYTPQIRAHAGITANFWKHGPNSLYHRDD